MGFSGSFRPWPPGSFPVGCPSPLEVPFAFKPFCLAEARAEGAGAALWLDSSCVAVRSLDPIFTAIEANGYVLFRNGSYWLGEWASDHTLSEYGLSRDRALALPEVNAAAIGLHFGSRIAVEFLESWHEAARAGTAFRGIPEPLQSWDDYEDVKWNGSGACPPTPGSTATDTTRRWPASWPIGSTWSSHSKAWRTHLVLEAGPRTLDPPRQSSSTETRSCRHPIPPRRRLDTGRREDPRRSRWIPSALLPRLHLGLRHGRQRLVGTGDDAAPRHHEDRRVRVWPY